MPFPQRFFLTLWFSKIWNSNSSLPFSLMASSSTVSSSSLQAQKSPMAEKQATASVETKPTSPSIAHDPLFASSEVWRSQVILSSPDSSLTFLGLLLPPSEMASVSAFFPSTPQDDILAAAPLYHVAYFDTKNRLFRAHPSKPSKEYLSWLNWV